tara:strand:- start:314 stop:1705 length:1392 start_codon:yes stop_codon:yes gene_type:complete
MSPSSFVQVIGKIPSFSSAVLSTDSRNLEAGSLFLALGGENFDGFKFVESALKKGALGVIFEIREGREEQAKKLAESFPDRFFIIVENSLIYFQELAKIKTRNWLDEDSEKRIIGITGSNGKTTYKEMLSWLLNAIYPGKVHYSKGNFNNHIGVPLTLLNLRSNHKIAVVELGTNHPGEIQGLCEIAQPNAGIITSIGSSHLEHFGDQEAVFKEKRSLFDYVRKSSGPESVFVLPSDDVFLKRLIDESVVSFGSKDKYVKLQIEAEAAKVWLGKDHSPTLLKNNNILGEHNFSNLAGSFLMASHLFPGNDDSLIKAAEKFKPLHNRGAWVRKSGKRYYLDAYNANPSSMIKSLEGFIGFCHDKSISFDECLFVLGDMNELGSESESFHEEIGRFMLEKEITKTLFIGKYAPAYQSGFLKRSLMFQSVEDFRPFWKEEQEKFKYFFIKASRSLQLESLMDITFD